MVSLTQIPQSDANPLMAELNRPWEEREAARLAAERMRAANSLERLDSALLDWDNFTKGKPRLQVSLAETKEQARDRMLVGQHVFMANGFKEPANPATRDFIRDSYAAEHFGGRGAGDDKAFAREMRKQAQGRQTHRALAQDLTTMAGAAAVSATMETGAGKADATSWEKWRDEARKKPGYEVANEAEYLEHWNRTQAAIKTHLAPFGPTLKDAWNALKGDDLNLSQFYGELADEEREPFLASLAVLARTMPAEAQASFWNNFTKSAERAGAGLMDDIIGGRLPTLPGFDGAKQDAEDREDYERQSMGFDAGPTREQRRIAMRNFEADINRIRDASYDPIKVLNPDNTFLRVGEKIAYGAPQTVGFMAVAALPGIGTPMSYAATESMLYRDMRDSAMQGGANDAAASAWANEAAPLVAIPYVALEKVGVNAALGKMPFFNQFLQGINNRVTNAAARFGARTVATAGAETVIENVQDLLPALTQEAASALSRDVPGVVWKNGKDGFLDGYWENTAVVFGTMLPLSVFAGLGGVQKDTRLRAFGEASDTELRALGITPENVKGIRAGMAQGPGSAEVAIEAALAGRNPMSEDAKAAVAELEAEIKAKQAATEEGQRSGVLPRFYRDGNGWTVFDGQTGAEVGKAKTPDDAMRIASAHSEAVDSANADQTAFLFTMLEAGEKTAGTKGTSFDFRPGEKVTTTQKAAESAVDEARILEQVAAKEAISGDGQFADIVLGQSATEFKERARETVNRINAGGSALTVFHEEAHGFWREARAQGRLTAEDAITAIRALDASLAGKTTKDGQPLRFLPDGEISETQLDEAVAELMEAEILRTRKTSSARNIPPGIITRNLTAMARLAPGAAKKFARFLATVREFFGVAFHRAAAIKQGIKEGKVDKAKLDDFTAKLFGLNEQDGHNEKAAGVASEITGEPAASFSLGPAKMADALIDQARKNVKAPKPRQAMLADLVSRLSTLRREKDQMITAFGQPAVREAIADPVKISDIRARFSLEKEAQSALMEEQGRSKEEIAEAVRQIGVREREAIAEQKRNYSPKARLLRALALLDGIHMALPPELRGKIGGYTQLAKLGTDEKRLEFLKGRVEKLNDVVEAYLKKEYGKLMEQLLERAKPAKDQAGKKRVGKAGGDVHALFDTLREAMKWDQVKVDAHIAGLEASIANGDLTAEQEAHAILEAGLVADMGNWKEADAARRASAVANAESVWNEAYAKFKLAKLMEREDREIRRAKLTGDTGKQGTKAERDAKLAKDNKLKGGWKDVILSLSSFEQVAQYIFGDKSTEASRLVEMESKASATKEDAVQAKMDAVEKLFADMAGGGLAGEQLRYRMSQKSIKAGGIGLSPLEAITATLMWRQEDGRRHMLGRQDENGKYVGPWHYDQAFIDEIEKQLSPEALAVRQHIADQYAAEWATLNPIYKTLNGINLPRHADYAPITVKPQQAQGGQMQDPVTGSTMSGASMTPGSLRTRGSAIAEPDFRDALQTYIAHTKQMEHWKAYAPFSMEAGAILRNRELGNAVEAKGGKEALSTLRAWLDLFAQGGTRDAAAHLAANQMLNRMVSRAAGAALVGRLGVLAIQSTQLGAALAEMPTGAYLKRMGKLFAGQLGWGAAKQSPYIQRRIQQMPPVVQQAMEGLMNAKPNAMKHWVRKMGQLISGVDGLFTAGTYAIIHDYQMTLARQAGLSEADAQAQADIAAERLTDRVAQPTRPGARSLYENTMTHPLARISWAFASEARQKLLLSVWALAKKPLGEKLRAVAVTWVIGGLGAAVIRAAWRDARNDDDDETFDEKNWGPKRLALSALTGPMGGVPVIGDMIEGAAFGAAGEYLPEGNMLSGSSPLGRSLRAATRQDWGEDKADDVMKMVETGLSVLAPLNDNISAAASLSHLVRDLWGVVENVVD